MSWKDLVRGKLKEKAPHIGSGPQLGSCKGYFFVRAEDTAKQRHLGLLWAYTLTQPGLDGWHGCPVGH